MVEVNSRSKRLVVRNRQPVCVGGGPANGQSAVGAAGSGAAGRRHVEHRGLQSLGLLRVANARGGAEGIRELERPLGERRERLGVHGDALRVIGGARIAQRHQQAIEGFFVEVIEPEDAIEAIGLDDSLQFLAELIALAGRSSYAGSAAACCRRRACRSIRDWRSEVIDFSDKVSLICQSATSDAPTIFERAAGRVGAAVREFAECLRVISAARIRQRAHQQRWRERDRGC